MVEKIKNILNVLNTKQLSPTDFSSENILFLLGVHYNEVVLCRLIKSVIEPDGFHGLGTKPLEMFFEKVLGIEKFEIDQPKIILEEKITDNRRVDIAIYNGSQVYPIEVKIWAKDQERQLNDYYSYYENKNKPDNFAIKKIYYLTPDGHDPSDLSIGELDKEKIRKLSFKEDIRE